MKKIIFIGLLFVWALGCSAQDLVMDFLEKNKNTGGLTHVNISSKMFQMISDITDAETESVIQNLKSMKIVTTEKEPGRYFREVMAMIAKPESAYEELMSIQEEGEDVRMYIREKNKIVSELVILVGGKKEFMLMNFCGIIDLKKISQLTKAVNIEGVEYLDKMKK